MAQTQAHRGPQVGNYLGQPIYETIETAGPEHDRTFTVEVTTCDKAWKSSAGSKREAERLSALQALEELGAVTLDSDLE